MKTVSKNKLLVFVIVLFFLFIWYVIFPVFLSSLFNEYARWLGFSLAPPHNSGSLIA